MMQSTLGPVLSGRLVFTSEGFGVGVGVVSGIGTLFSLDPKLYASDYDSDSVASENQSLERCPLKESNKGSKKRQGPTLGVR